MIYVLQIAFWEIRCDVKVMRSCMLRQKMHWTLSADFVELLKMRSFLCEVTKLLCVVIIALLKCMQHRHSGWSIKTWQSASLQLHAAFLHD